MVDAQKGEAPANEPTARPALASGGSPAGAETSANGWTKKLLHVPNSWVLCRDAKPGTLFPWMGKRPKGRTHNMSDTHLCGDTWYPAPGEQRLLWKSNGPHQPWASPPERSSGGKGAASGPESLQCPPETSQRTRGTHAPPENMPSAPGGWREPVPLSGGTLGTVVRDAGQRWTSAPCPAKGLPRLDRGSNGGEFSSFQAQSVLHLLPSVHTWPLFLLWGERRPRTRLQSSSNGEREQTHGVGWGCISWVLRAGGGGGSQETTGHDAEPRPDRPKLQPLSPVLRFRVLGPPGRRRPSGPLKD